MTKRIPIAEAKRVADAHGYRQVLILAWDGEQTHVVTYGKTKADCAAIAKAQDWWNGKVLPQVGATRSTNKPDWKNAPAWANWLAMDQDGRWYWYEKRPTAWFQP